jgi:nucleoside-triphosphatase
MKMTMSRILILTGAPGVGKTTVLSKTAEALKKKGVSVGGMVTHEVREANVRVGFEILDLTSAKHGWLAQVKGDGPQVGKYHVNLCDLDKIGTAAITQALEKNTVVAVDEVGPMELYSPKFKQAIVQALESKKVLLMVVHGKAKDPLVTQIKRRADAEIFNVTFGNREMLPEKLTKRILN